MFLPCGQDYPWAPPPQTFPRSPHSSTVLVPWGVRDHTGCQMNFAHPHTLYFKVTFAHFKVSGRIDQSVILQGRSEVKTLITLTDGHTSYRRNRNPNNISPEVNSMHGRKQQQNAAVWKLILLKRKGKLKRSNKWMKKEKKNNEMVRLLFLVHLFCILWQKKNPGFDWTQMWCLRLLHTSKSLFDSFSVALHWQNSLPPSLHQYYLWGAKRGSTQWVYVRRLVQDFWVWTNNLQPSLHPNKPMICLLSTLLVTSFWTNLNETTRK